MKFNRRARPTLRVVKDDLISDWASPFAQRALEEDRLSELHPLSELPHPIVQKALNSFGNNSANDVFVGPIQSSTKLRLLEIKHAQWRGGVWQDPETGVCWLVVAGLAKGGHDDHEDFYKKVERADKNSRSESWLPQEEDLRLLNQETVASLRTEWELDIQEKILEALKEINLGGSAGFVLSNPLNQDREFAVVDLEVSLERSEDGIDTDDILVRFTELDRSNPSLMWALKLRVLISINPPESGWVPFGEEFSNMGEPGDWTRRIESLTKFVEDRELVKSEGNSSAHYAHKRHLGATLLKGEAVRSLCGIYFVQLQDHESLERCPVCQSLYAALPK